MAYAELSRLMLVAILAAGLSACAGLQRGPGKAPASSAARQNMAAEATVNPAAKRDFDSALKAMQAGNDKEAERLLGQLAAKYPELSGPKANLGIVYLRSGRLAEAERVVAQAIKQNPSNATYYNLLGIIDRTAGKFTEARKAYDAALLIDANYAYAHLNIAILYDLYLNDGNKALQHYQRYQALSPKEDTQVVKWIVDLQQRMKKTERRTSG